jgi:hypothetical protein
LRDTRKVERRIADADVKPLEPCAIDRRYDDNPRKTLVQRLSVLRPGHECDVLPARCFERSNLFDDAIGVTVQFPAKLRYDVA